MTRRDLVVTWPKNRVLGSYLAEINNARRDGLLINYRVHNPPALGDQPLAADGTYLDCRLYRVHNGWLRGWTPVRRVEHRGAGEVARVRSDPQAGHWPEGFYIVCEPIFHDCPTLQIPGFRGWRWFDRTSVRAEP